MDITRLHLKSVAYLVSLVLLLFVVSTSCSIEYNKRIVGLRDITKPIRIGGGRIRVGGINGYGIPVTVGGQSSTKMKSLMITPRGSRSISTIINYDVIGAKHSIMFNIPDRAAGRGHLKYTVSFKGRSSTLQMDITYSANNSIIFGTPHVSEDVPKQGNGAPPFFK